MNNKIEIFTMCIAAGSETFTDEQIKFLVGCLIKTEKLTAPQVPKGQKHDSYKPKGQKTDSYKPKGQKTDGYKPKGQKTDGYKPKEQKHDVYKQVTGQSLFMREKMAELKTNGSSYLENRTIATECWKSLSPEEQKDWDNKIIKQTD